MLLRGGEVPPGVAAELAALPGLRGRPGEGLLSAGTARVSFNAFDGMETVSLERLPGRLLAEDPRYDPWLRGLPRYFRVLLEGEPWSVVYLRTRLSAPLLEPALRRIAARGGSAARVLEADSGARWALAALGAAFLLALLAPRLARGRRRCCRSRARCPGWPTWPRAASRTCSPSSSCSRPCCGPWRAGSGN